MKKIRLLFSALLLFAHASAFAGPISEAFSGEVFGVPWGANLQQIKEKFPNGELVGGANIVGYLVKDDRKVFGLERPNNSLAFNLDADGAFYAIDIEFPLVTSDDFGVRIAKLTTLFGRPESSHSFSAGLPGLSYIWPAENGLKLSVSGIFGLFGLGGKTLVRVDNTLTKAPLNKTDLGL